jgi:hypothetical protein
MSKTPRKALGNDQNTCRLDYSSAGKQLTYVKESGINGCLNSAALQKFLCRLKLLRTQASQLQVIDDVGSGCCHG